MSNTQSKHKRPQFNETEKTMQILSAKLDMNWKVLNEPRLHISVDKKPSIDDILFKEHTEEGAEYYWGEKDGFVMFFICTDNKNGFGGAHIKINLVDGTQRTLKGPWSSNPTAMANVGFPYCMEVTVETPDNPMSHYGGHLTINRTLEAIKFIPKLRLYAYENRDWEKKFVYVKSYDKADKLYLIPNPFDEQ